MDIKVNDQLVLKISDILDDAAMLYFDATRNPDIESSEVTNYRIQKLHLNFYDCLIKIINVFLKVDNIEDIPENFEKQINDKLKELEQLFENETINSEELRRALLFQDIKAFKNLHYPIDYITPDAVSYLAYIISSYILKNKKEALILDPNLGTGNLAFTLANYLDMDVTLIGYENHELLSRVAAVKADFLQQKLIINQQDCLMVLPNNIDLIVSDPATHNYHNDDYSSYLYDQGISYFPYLLIEHYLKMEKNLKMVLIIDNDFFNQKGSNVFKELISKTATIEALIVLPETFFSSINNLKSILVLNINPKEKGTSTEIYQLPNPNEQDKFKSMLNDIRQLLTKE